MADIKKVSDVTFADVCVNPEVLESMKRLMNTSSEVSKAKATVAPMAQIKVTSNIKAKSNEKGK